MSCQGGETKVEVDVVQDLRVNLLSKVLNKVGTYKQDTCLGLCI